MRILEGITVLDIGRYVAGPYCATLLGYLGAQVIRIERPQGGDDRDIAPLDKHGIGAVFMQTGSNKESLAMRLSAPESKPILAKLIADADVVVSNFPPAAQQKLGLDYQSLCDIKSDIIFANATAFGEVGPMANEGGFDGVAQAMSGAMYMTGVPGQPAKAAAPYADYTTGVLLAFGVMAALRERDISGKGQQVSGSLLGTAMATFNSHLVEQSALDIKRHGSGNRVQTSAPSDLFATLDGHVLVHCPGDGIFKRWANFIGKPEWIEDSRFISDQSRGDHRDVICGPMAELSASLTTADLLERLKQAGIPCGEVLTPAETLNHPQTRALDVLTEIDYPGAPNAQVVDLPISFSESKAGIERRPPTIGEHTTAILTRLGFESAQIDAWRESGIIA